VVDQLALSGCCASLLDRLDEPALVIQKRIQGLAQNLFGGPAGSGSHIRQQGLLL